jgi:hypothetical protein
LAALKAALKVNWRVAHWVDEKEKMSAALRDCFEVV